MLLSIIIPYYNEPTLIQVLDNVYNVQFQGTFEIIIVDDGSTDGTTTLLEKNISKYKNAELIKHSVNKGKGAAIKTALKNSKGDIIIIQDADLEYNPIEIPKVIQPIIDNKTLVCYGSRHLGKEQRKRNFLWFKKHAGHTLFPYLGGRLITIACSVLFFIRLTDVLTCYKAYDANLLKSISLKNNGFEMEGELAAKTLKKTKILEIPVSFTPRTVAEGKKIKWTDGFKLLFTVIKYRFVS